MKYDRAMRGAAADSRPSLLEMLHEGEQVLWSGKPKKSAFIANKVLRLLPLVLLWFAVDVGFLCAVYIFDVPTVVRIVVTAFIAVHLLPFWIWLSDILTASALHKNTEYAITDRRILLRDGLLGIDFRSVLYSEIKAVNLRVGLVDRMFKVGDLYFVSSGSRGNVFFDLERPYEVYKIAQKIVTDIQADIAFPNAYRPARNEGYKTKYGEEERHGDE